MTAKLSFYGAARTVTGSNFLLETDNAKILVDCGLRQGSRYADEENREPFVYDAASIDALIVTHAHIDHIGLIPKLVREGFTGKIFATAPTKGFAEILLEDSARIIGHEAKEDGVKPPYEPRDVPEAIRRFTPIEYHTPTLIAPGVTATFYDAGHVLGSAFVIVEAEGTRTVFSGDLGNSPMPLLKDLESLPNVDYVVMESTYGDRVHEDMSRRREKLAQAVASSIARGGTLLIASFAFERAQELLAELNDIVEAGDIPKVPFFLDSPLAIKATAVYQRFPKYYNEEAQQEIVEEGDIPFRFPGLTFTKTSRESKHINTVPPPKVIIASSGMLSGGRILHHAVRVLPDVNSMLLIVGYQAPGTLGRRLLTRPKHVTMMGHKIPVNARVKAIGGYSAHADQEALLSWVSGAGAPKRVFLVHGEEASAMALADAIRETHGFETMVPKRDETVVLR